MCAAYAREADRLAGGPIAEFFEVAAIGFKGVLTQAFFKPESVQKFIDDGLIGRSGHKPILDGGTGGCHAELTEASQ